MKAKILMVFLLVTAALASTTNNVMPSALKNANRPMIIVDYNWWDDAGIITNANIQADNTKTQIALCGAHDITSGYGGTVTVYTTAEWLLASDNNEDPTDTNVTTFNDGLGCQVGNNTIVTHDGDVMWGLYNATVYTSDAWTLFGNAINWAWDNWYSANT